MAILGVNKQEPRLRLMAEMEYCFNAERKVQNRDRRLGKWTPAVLASMAGDAPSGRPLGIRPRQKLYATPK